MRKSFLFFTFVGVSAIFLAGLLLWSRTEVARFSSTSADLREMTSALDLTDMSFSSDARYTRHPSQADLFSAFQDYPGSIEHFPSGSVTPPPDYSSLETRLEVKRK